MTHVTRRTFLATSAAFAAAPALLAPARAAPVPSSGNIDVVIVGAGAAGIAAARRVVAAGRRCVVIEAADQVGGRCITDTRTFGVPYDRGARWLRAPDINPVVKLAASARLDISAAPPGQRLRIGRRFAREGEMEDFLSALVRASRAIGEAARAKADIPCAQMLPKDLGDLRPAIEFVLGPFNTSKDLNEISAYDFARATERDTDAFCRQGLGTLLARLADGLPLNLSTAATMISTWGYGNLAVQTTKGWWRASAVIVTASTAVLAAGKIRFEPALPKRYTEAIAKLPLGSYDRIVLELEGNPLGLRNDELVFERATGNRTAALLANASGTPLCMVDVGGRFGASLAAQGEGAMTAFAIDWLADLFGTDIKKAVKRKAVTNWAKEPWVLGAFSAAAVGGQPSRRVLMEPIGTRIYFAGEAAHESLWGTVNGAWESGERAADAVLKRYGPPPAAKRPRKG
jgi:flavin-dependent amine oxidoreductase/putative NAD(P)-binding protein